MTLATKTANALIRVGDAYSQLRHNRLVEKLIDRLPRRVQVPVRWLRRPSSRWARIPAGVLLIGGGFLSILPIFGLWMLPVGLFLLAEDVPLLRRARNHILDRIQRRRPHWFDGDEGRRASVLRRRPGAGAIDGIDSCATVGKEIHERWSGQHP